MIVSRGGFLALILSALLPSNCPQNRFSPQCVLPANGWDFR